jgi:superfamily II DNA or RNA helicase
VLRDYQRQCLGAIAELRRASPDVTRVAVEMATGLGKTITFAAAADEYLDSFDGAGNRVLVLAHTDELIEQAAEKIRTVTRGRWTIGIVKARQNEVEADIVVASVATLARPDRRSHIRDVGLIIVDECHHAVASTYLDILEHFGGIPHTEWHIAPTPVLGVTATLARSDGQGLGKVWQDVAFTRSLAWGIRHGYLIDLVPYTIKIPGVDAGASDAALDAMLADSIAPEAVVDAWLEYAWSAGWTSSSTVLFAPLVRSAEAFAAAFNEAGVKAEVVHGKLAPAERKAILDRYEQGITTVVCNAMVLTEGWDSPRTMCVIVARPTQSVPLFMQMVGRGVRPWLGAEAPAREDQRCVLLCVAGATNELATIADLSDRQIDAQDGKSLLQMEDEWDLGRDLDPDEDRAYRGPVVVERWDAAVRASTKAWKYTAGGVPFLPTAKHGEGYVFITPVGDHWTVWAREPAAHMRGKYASLPCATAPDLELAMALAEDEAQERGGDIGRLLADKGRAWRKAVPSPEMLALAGRYGINVTPVMQDKRAGKAGRLSDMIDKAAASRVLDGIATKIRERASDDSSRAISTGDAGNHEGVGSA